MTSTEQLLREALEDLLNGWKYIRRTHGDLYGVGWDRAQSKGESALAALPAPAPAQPASPTDMAVYDSIAQGYFKDTAQPASGEAVAWRWRNTLGDVVTGWLELKPSQRQAIEQQVAEAGGTIEYAYTTPSASGEAVADEQIIEWATRHDLKGTLVELRCIFEDAASIGATPPASQEQSKWCEYVAGMVDTWVSAEWPHYMHMDEDRRTKAIAGIIERRLWALKREASTSQPKDPS
jgi:hypothetical protein